MDGSEATLSHERIVAATVLQFVQTGLDSADLRPILEHMQDMDLDILFEETLCVLNPLVALQSIKCLGLVFPRESQAVRQQVPQQVHPLFPCLEKFRFFNGRLSVDIVTMLSRCERLVDVYCDVACLDPITTAEHEALWPYFQRLQAFRF